MVPQRRAALEKLVLHATNLRIPIVEVEGGSLTALAGFDGHQGVALVVEPRRFASLDDVLARAAERAEPPFILVLDSLEDPHNVGTLLRSAEAAGVHGVVFPTHRQAPLSPSAVKASAGAIEHLLLCPVDDLPGALSDLHSRGIRVAGAEGDAPMTAREADLRGPLAIVVGSEGQGLGPAVRRRSDLFVRIPMKGVVGSLNAAVAGSILLFEALAQREPGAGSERAASRWSPTPDAPTTADGTASRGADAREVSEAADTTADTAIGEPGDQTAAALEDGPAADEPIAARTPPRARRSSRTAAKDDGTPEPADPSAEEPTPRPKRPRRATATPAPEVLEAADAGPLLEPTRELKSDLPAEPAPAAEPPTRLRRVRRLTAMPASEPSVSPEAASESGPGPGLADPVPGPSGEADPAAAPAPRPKRARRMTGSAAASTDAADPADTDPADPDLLPDDTAPKAKRPARRRPADPTA